MIALAEAVQRVLAGASPLPAETVLLLDAAGRVLAEPVHASFDMPPWDNSAMDGYAVRAGDIAGASDAAPVTLRVLETVAAGDFPAVRVASGEATRIMTGAPIPEGADCVVRVEDSDGGTERVRIRSDRDAGRHIRPRGEDLRAGAVALQAGLPILGARLGLLAALGEQAVRVHRRPRVAILSSGDELVTLDRADEARAGRRIVASNGYALAALLRADGAEVVDLGIAPDDPVAIASLARGAAGCDLLVTTAGASIGEHDYTSRALAQLGMQLDFWRVRVRPGSQTAFGRLTNLDGLPWLGLPGNPVSALVTYELFVRPLVRTWLGHAAPYRCPITVTLDEPAKVAPGRDFIALLRTRLTTDDEGRFHARLTGPQGTGLQTSMAHADALLVVPAGVSALDRGAAARALPLGDTTIHARESCW